MSQTIQSCASFGVFLCLGAYFLGVQLNKRFKSTLTNPLLLATAGIIALLALCGIDYEAFKASAQPLSYLLTPATICLGLSLYEQLQKLKKELYEIIAKHSGQTFDKVWADSDRDYWMTAAEAKEYGMIDEVLIKKQD